MAPTSRADAPVSIMMNAIPTKNQRNRENVLGVSVILSIDLSFLSKICMLKNTHLHHKCKYNEYNISITKKNIIFQRMISNVRDIVKRFSLDGRRETKDQGLVVRKPINANLGLKLNRGFSHFSCQKRFQKLFLIYMWRQVKVETKGQKYFEKTYVDQLCNWNQR